MNDLCSQTGGNVHRPTQEAGQAKNGNEPAFGKTESTVASEYYL